jgi:hypothetical protein
LAVRSEDDEDGADDEPTLGRPEFLFFCKDNPPEEKGCYWQSYTSEGNQDLGRCLTTTSLPFAA